MSDYSDRRDLILSGVAFPGPDGTGHLQFAASKIADSLALEGGTGLALTWLARAMPTYRLLLTTEQANEFETAVKLACAHFGGKS